MFRFLMWSKKHVPVLLRFCRMLSHRSHLHSANSADSPHSRGAEGHWEWYIIWLFYGEFWREFLDLKRFLLWKFVLSLKHVRSQARRILETKWLFLIETKWLFLIGTKWLFGGTKWLWNEVQCNWIPGTFFSCFWKRLRWFPHNIRAIMAKIKLPKKAS